MSCRLKNKLFFLVFLALLGLILEAVVFSSPSWAVFKFPVNKDGSLKELGGTLAGLEYNQNEPDERYATVFIGLWKCETCALIFEDDDDDGYDDHGRKKRGMGYGGGWDGWRERCHGYGYKNTWEKAEELPEKEAPIKQMNKHIGVTAHLGLTEYQVETVIGLAAAVVGLVASIMYARTKAQKGSLGVVCCLCLLTSGVLYWTAIGKIHTTLCQMRALIVVLKMAPVKIPTPWCLVVGGIAATFELIAGVVVMEMLSRNNQKDDTPCTPQEPEPCREPIGQATGSTSVMTDVNAEKKAYVLPEYEAEPPPYDQTQLTKAEEAGLPADKF